MRSFSIIFAMLFFASSVNVFAGEPSIKGSTVKYGGHLFTISVDNVNEAAQEIANAQKVYAFVVSDIDMSTGNTSDFPDTYYNSSLGEYAIECWVNDKDKNYKQQCFVIFGLKDARVTKTLPEGFEYNTSEIDVVGSNTKAGYCYAENKGKHNSYIVYVK